LDLAEHVFCVDLAFLVLFLGESVTNIPGSEVEDE
jgi:hypothetical protein